MKMDERISVFGVKFGFREEYAIEYLEQIQQQFGKLCKLDPNTAVRGRGHRKTSELRMYDALSGYIVRLKKYSDHFFRLLLQTGMEPCAKMNYAYFDPIILIWTSKGYLMI